MICTCYFVKCILFFVPVCPTFPASSWSLYTADCQIDAWLTPACKHVVQATVQPFHPAPHSSLVGLTRRLHPHNGICCCTWLTVARLLLALAASIVQWLKNCWHYAHFLSRSVWDSTLFRWIPNDMIVSFIRPNHFCQRLHCVHQLGKTSPTVFKFHRNKYEL